MVLIMPMLDIAVYCFLGAVIVGALTYIIVTKVKEHKEK